MKLWKYFFICISRNNNS